MRGRQGCWLCFYGDLLSLWVNTRTRQEGLLGNHSNFQSQDLELLGHTHTHTHTHQPTHTHTHTVLLDPSPSHIHQEVCWWGRGPSGSGLYVLYYMYTTASAHKRFAQAWTERPWCPAADPAKTQFCLKSVIHHVWIWGSGFCGNGR